MLMLIHADEFAIHVNVKCTGCRRRQPLVTTVNQLALLAVTLLQVSADGNLPDDYLEIASNL